MTTIIPEPDIHNVWRTETPGNDGWQRSARPDAAGRLRRQSDMAAFGRLFSAVLLIEIGSLLGNYA